MDIPVKLVLNNGKQTYGENELRFNNQHIKFVGKYKISLIKSAKRLQITWNEYHVGPTSGH